MKFIDTTKLINWADTLHAEGELPDIIKQLIRAACPEIGSLRFPSGDAVHMPGFDGILVHNGKASEYVPEGLSVWETSTERNPKTKANKDYEKRTEAEIENRENVTFVFVTPRRWNGIDDWVKEKNGQAKWKEVRAIDGVTLEDWLEDAPSVALYFYIKLGYAPPEGISLIQDEWEHISRFSNPKIIESLVTAGRDNEVKELIKRLTSDPQHIIVKDDSPQAALAFSMASLLSIKDEELKKTLLSRTLVASTEDLARRLPRSRPLIILLKEDRAKSSALASYGHHVIIPKGTGSLKLSNPIVLTRPDSELFGKELVKMGFSEEEAQRHAKACNRSITIFHRMHPAIDAEPPEWATEDKAQILIPAMLAGRWDATSEADKKILCTLYRESEYQQIEQKLQVFLSVNEHPMQKHGEVWAFTAPADAFTLMARYVFGEQFESFKDVFREVFGELDPMVDLKPEERPYASLRNATLKHSEWLRSGLAETLLLISELGPNIKNIQCPGEPKLFSNSVISSVPNLRDWKMVASLRDQYPTLMEAAPDPLLGTLESLLEGNPEGFKILTEEGETLFGGHAMHTGLLWGLETIAWDPRYLKRVALILAQLALHDHGGRLANRPINSLREIFLYWHPGTNANLQQRIEALGFVIDKVPEIAWPLLEQMLPSTGNSVAHNTSRPKWREAGEDDKETLTWRVVWDGEEFVISKALDFVESDPGKWKELLYAYRRFNEGLQKKVIRLLQGIAESDTDSDLRARLWNVLRDFVNRNLSNQDTNWAVSRKTLKPFEGFIHKLEPDDLIDKNLWLFKDEYLDLPDVEKHKFDDEARKVSNRLRCDAIKPIVDTLGLPGVIEVAARAQMVGLVAMAVIPALKTPQDAISLIEMSVEKGEQFYPFIACISSEGLRHYKNDWKELLVDKIKEAKWPISAEAHAFLFWPDNRETWDTIETFDSDLIDEFWKSIRFFSLRGTVEDKVFQIDQLIKAGRSKDIFDAVAFREDDVPSEKMLEIARETLKALSTIKDERELKANCPSRAREFIQSLQSREDIEKTELAKLEYSFLPLLGYHHGIDLTLYTMLSQDPTLFIEVLCDVYKPSHQKEDREITSQQRSRAQYGFQLLEGWNKIPGLKEDGTFDQELLNKWISAAHALAVETDREAIGDQSIGNILAHSPKDPEDNAWPHRAVREVIEHFKSEEIEIGISIERHNMRGTFSKAMFEGGKQERELAEQYKLWAKTCDPWPRTRNLLERIAESWGNDARRADDRAEQDRIRFA